MRLLLDTHTFLWWVADDPRLSDRARRAIGNPRNDVLLSVVSVWEIIAKSKRGRLRIDDRPTRFVLRQLEANAIEVLPLTLPHTLAVADLPEHHHDPFDRLLIAQATSERIAVVSGDSTVRRYPVKVVW